MSHWFLGSVNWQPRAAPRKDRVRMTLTEQYTQPFEVWRDVTLPATDRSCRELRLPRRIITAIERGRGQDQPVEIMRAG